MPGAKVWVICVAVLLLVSFAMSAAIAGNGQLSPSGGADVDANDPPRSVEEAGFPAGPLVVVGTCVGVLGLGVYALRRFGPL